MGFGVKTLIISFIKICKSVKVVRGRADKSGKLSPRKREYGGTESGGKLLVPAVPTIKLKIQFLRIHTHYQVLQNTVTRSSAANCICEMVYINSQGPYFTYIMLYISKFVTDVELEIHFHLLFLCLLTVK
jgi:hypothetical protein